MLVWPGWIPAMGLSGLIGCAAVYGSVLTAEKQAEKRDSLKTVMSLRGQFVNGVSTRRSYLRLFQSHSA